MSRPARPEDVDAICGALPETWFVTSWGDVATWLVPHREHALVDAARPFFTIPHFDGDNAVLVQLSRLAEICRDELAEVLTDARRACAPKSLVTLHRGG